MPAQERRPRVLLIGPEYEENLSLRYLAASLQQQEIDWEIAPFNSAAHVVHILKTVERTRPDIVGLSLSFQVRAMEFLNLAAQIRRQLPQCHIVVGGHFATICARELLQDFPALDSIIRGEGEQALGTLAKAVTGGAALSTIQNLVFRDEHGRTVENPRATDFPDLDRLPWPVRSNTPEVHLGFKTARIMGSRGCFHSSCRYCCIAAFHAGKCGKHYALRSVATIVEEMDSLRKQGFRIFFFHDDNFLLDTEQASLHRFDELREALRAANLNDIRFYIKCRPSSVTPATAAAMKALGVGNVFVGIENHAKSILKYLGRTETPEHSLAAIKCLRDEGITVNYNLILFTPSCTAEDVRANLEFVQANLDVPFNFGRLELYAGTPLEKEMIAAGKVSGSYLGLDYCMDSMAMERIARACRIHMARRRLDYQGLANQNITLAYHADIARRFFPGPIADRFSEETRQRTMDINTDTLNHLRTLLTLCADETLSESAYNDATNIIGQQIAEADQRLRNELLKLDRRIAAYCRVCRWAEQFRLAKSSDLRGPVFERMLGIS